MASTLHHKPALVSADSLVKDFTKKRWLILALLSAEIETLVTTQYPLETTREALVALLSNLDYGTALGINALFPIQLSKLLLFLQN